jgi:hypothetical protein
MTILPLVERELRVRARSPAGYWLRFTAALAGILVCLPMLALRGGALPTQAQSGAYAFNGLVVAAFILCCFSGFLSVDGISRERREGTLGLLFLTRVRALDVLLGNFGAAGMASLCALAAFVPVLIVPVLTGGVSGGEAARKVLALFDTMILSLAAGLWASAGGRGWSSCARSAAGLLCLLIFGPLLLGSPQLFRVDLSAPGPLRALVAASDASYRRLPAPYWVSIAIIHAISWLLVIGAGFRLHRAIRADDEAPAKTASPARTRKRLMASEAPLEWLMRRQRGVGSVVWAGALLRAAYYLEFMFFVRYTRLRMGGYSIQGMGLSCSVVEDCLFAWVASRFFIQARRSGELELLLTTPEGAWTLVASQWNWLQGLFRWPLVVLVAPPIILTFINMPKAAGFVVVSSPGLIFFFLNSVAGVFALLRVGMWFGWSERSQTRALIRTIIVAAAAPYCMGLLASIVLMRIASPWIFSVSSGPIRLLPILVQNAPQVVFLLYYLWLIRWARRRLATALRPAAGCRPV